MDSVHRSIRIPRDVNAWVETFAAENYEGNVNMTIIVLLRKAIKCFSPEVVQAHASLGEMRARRVKDGTAR